MTCITLLPLDEEEDEVGGGARGAKGVGVLPIIWGIVPSPCPCPTPPSAALGSKRSFSFCSSTSFLKYTNSWVDLGLILEVGGGCMLVEVLVIGYR